MAASAAASRPRSVIHSASVFGFGMMTTFHSGSQAKFRVSGAIRAGRRPTLRGNSLGLCEEAQVGFAAGDTGAVEVFAERDRVLARGAEQVADLGDGRAGAASQPLGDAAAHLGLDARVQK